MFIQNVFGTIIVYSVWINHQYDIGVNGKGQTYLKSVLKLFTGTPQIIRIDINQLVFVQKSLKA